jgi:poly(hydroxyalkanoate) granule-associated protein
MPKGDVMATEDERQRRGGQDDDFAGSLRGSARQIWLAGLGALARAQEEGSKLFDTLAREGASLQGRLDPQAQAQFERARSTVADLAAKASDRIEELFNQRVAKALDRLDVPLGGEFDALTARVEALERAIAAAAAPQAGSRRRGRRGDQDADAAPPANSEPE